jgi:hypothetical protein
VSNDKVYIHEFVDITKQGRARYLQHITANWSPLAQEERNQLCYGVWGVVGSTGAWPQVVNMWEEDGFEGLASSFALELGSPTLQDPGLAKWWAAAADLRSGGLDRIMVPHHTSLDIGQLCTAGAGGAVYAHELIRVEKGQAVELLDLVAEGSADAHSDTGWSLIGAFRTVMGQDDECLLLWSIPDWPTWGAAERSLARGAVDVIPASAHKLLLNRERILLVDAPLAPLRTGRQPSRSDRTDWVE